MFNLKKHYRKVILLFVLIISNQLADAQCAENIGFEDSTFAFWQGYFNGYGLTTPLGCCPIQTPIGPITTEMWPSKSVADSRIKITTGLGVDKYSNIPIVCNIPGFGVNSVKLGNDSTNSESEKIKYVLAVTSQNADLVYAYAAVLQNGGHLPADQPRLEAHATDQFGNKLSCADFNIPTPDAANLPPLWFVSPIDANVVCSNWILTALNLRPYIGQTVSIEFATGDCSQSGHFGYAYIDLACQKFQIKIAYCPGDTVATLIAPTGFSNYVWDTIGTPNPPIMSGTNSQLLVSHPDSTIGYSVKLGTGLSDTCVVELYDTIRQLPMPDADFYYLPNPACVGYPVNLVDDSKSNIDYAYINNWQWVLKDPNATKKIDTSLFQNLTHTFTAEGDYYVGLQVRTNFNCISSALFKRKVHVVQPSIHLSDSLKICKKSAYQLTFVSDDKISKTHWFLNSSIGNLSCNDCFDPLYSTEYPNKVYVFFTDNHGCTNTDSVRINVMDCPEIIVPSAFSPNGDKKNDYFFMLDRKFTKLNYFQIYNRWGELVYSTDDINALGWDGSFNGKEQGEGTFTYKIMATDINGNIKTLNGNVTLVK